MSKKNKKSKTREVPSKNNDNIVIATEPEHKRTTVRTIQNTLDIIRMIGKLIIEILLVVFIGALILLAGKGFGDFALSQFTKPSSKTVKEENIGDIISIKTEKDTDDNFFDSSPASYKIKYMTTENGVTTVKTETITEDEIILDDTMEKPIAVKCYYKKLIFKADKIYLKISTKDFKDLKQKTDTIY